MSIIGDVLGTAAQAVAGPAEALAGALDGSASSAPVPSVRSRPAAIAAARPWSAPEAGGGGQVTVHRDVLRGVAVGMRSDLRDLDRSVSGLSAAGHGVSSIAGWPTAAAFTGNAGNAYDGVLRASQQAGNAHQATSKKLGDSAATYDQAEADTRQAIYSVGTHLNAVTGMVAAPGSGQAASASAAAGGATAAGYPVKTNAVASFSGTGMSAAQVMSILHGLDPGAVAAAGEAHTSIGTTLDDVAARLVTNAHTLAQNWSGSAAQAAMGQFQQLHDHTAALAQQALQVGAVLTWLGRDVLPSFKALPDPSVSLTSLVLSDAAAGAAAGGALGGAAGEVTGGLIGGATGAVDSLLGVAQSAADKTAQEYLESLSRSLVTANNTLPPMIGGTGVPGSAAGSGAGARTGAGAGGGAAGGGADGAVAGAGGGVSGGGSGTSLLAASAGGAPLVAGAAGAASRAGTAGGASGTGAAGLPGAGTAGGTSSSPVPSSVGSLQSAPVPGGPVSPSAVGSPTAGPAPLSPPAAPATGVPVPGVGGLQGVGGLGGSGVPSPVPDDPAVPDDPGALDDPAAPELPVVGPDSGLSGVVPGMPGVPGVSGQGAVASGAAAENVVADSAVADVPVTDGAVGVQPISTDDSLSAGGADGSVSPGMAGFPMAGGGGAQQERERRRQAWMNEEEDIWGLPAGLVPSVVEGGE